MFDTGIVVTTTERILRYISVKKLIRKVNSISVVGKSRFPYDKYCDNKGGDLTVIVRNFKQSSARKMYLWHSVSIKKFPLQQRCI
jgi:hypothetical protein